MEPDVHVDHPGCPTWHRGWTAADAGMQDFRQIAIPAEAIARAIAFAIKQPNDVDVSEIIVRPTASPY